jgi:hypothetical protein
MRDLSKDPYRPDELRVVEYLLSTAPTNTDYKEDPVGFLIDLHKYTASVLRSFTISMGGP